MFGTIINIFKKLPFPALILFYGLIPTFFLMLTTLFIIMHIDVICPSTILNLLFHDNHSTGYKITYEFIMSGMEFFGGFIDKMFEIIKITFDSILGEGNFFNDPMSQQNQCISPVEPKGKEM
jgi:hypothetical protein